VRIFFAGIALLSLIAVTSAPGDRYFGRLKMSALRIRYETMQLKKRYESHALLPEDTQHLLLLTEEAYRQWAALYPHDPWLPSTGFLLAQLYEELPSTTARDHAVALLGYVKSHFPTSPYARRSSAQLHRGISTRPYPQWASDMRAPTPSLTPSAPPYATPSTSLTAQASPLPSASNRRRPRAQEFP
jgi:hypothetical protein